MTRRRSSAPGRDRPDRRRSFLHGPVAMLLLAALVAACGGTSRATGAPGTTTPSTDPAASGPTTSSASTSPDPVASEPTPSDPAPSDALPTVEPATDPPGASDGAPSAAACSGTAENRDFYAAVADAVSWPVYCPVLPRGWFVDAGQYRLAGGGRMEIAYRGPDGARLELREGAFCESDDCAPDGADLGSAAFGDLSGTLVDLGDGRYAVLVDPDASPSWTLVSTGLSEAEIRDVADTLALVEG